MNTDITNQENEILEENIQVELDKSTSLDNALKEAGLDKLEELPKSKEEFDEVLSKRGMPTFEQLEMIKKKLKGEDIDKSITLQDCINVIDGFIDGSVSVEQLEAFGAKMQIRAYIPIMEKMSVLMEILMKHEISAVENTAIRMTELYKDIFFTVVMRVYGQVQFDYYNKNDKELLTYENYDKLFPIFNQYILTYCRDDYEVFMSMLKDCISLNGVENMVQAMESMDVDKIQESVESNKQLVESLKDNKEMVENLKDMLMATDETTKNVVEGIKKMTTSEVIEKSKIKMEEDKNKVIGVDFGGNDKNSKGDKDD